jgi:hypothetical protein
MGKSIWIAKKQRFELVHHHQRNEPSRVKSRPQYFTHISEQCRLYVLCLRSGRFFPWRL